MSETPITRNPNGSVNAPLGYQEESYYYITAYQTDTGCSIEVSSREWFNNPEDYANLALQNVFLTEEECQAVIDQLAVTFFDNLTN